MSKAANVEITYRHEDFKSWAVERSADTPSQESGLDEQDSQWQWYMSNESSRRALFKNVNIKIVFVQIKIIITILLFCHISSTKFAYPANLFRG